MLRFFLVRPVDKVVPDPIMFRTVVVWSACMKSEIDILLAQSEDRIVSLRDELRLEERIRDRLRERLLAIRAQKPSPEPTNQANHHDGENGQGSNGGHRPARTIATGSLTSHVIAVLEEAGHSLKAREIADRVMARGYTTTANGGVPVAVSTTLAHDHGKVFKKISYGVYDLRSRHETTLPEGDSN